MKKELIDRILQILIKKGCYRPDMPTELEIIFADYDISERHTELAVINEDEDQMLMKKFFTAKIVKGLSDRTLKYYRDTIDQFRARVQKDLSKVTSDDIRLYLAIRRKKDEVSDTTAGNELRNLRSFYNWLYTEELIKTNPIAKVEKIKQAKTKKEAFSERDIELIRGRCKNARETAIIEILLSTGCRVSELTHMKREDIKGNAVLVHGKGNKDRIVYLNAKAQIALERYMDERSDNSAYIFPKGISIITSSLTRKEKGYWYRHPELIKNEPQDAASIEGTVRKIGINAGVKNTHPHRFRRTCATFALRRGMPIIQVSKMLGHESVATTQIYLDISEEELEQAHRKFVV